MKPNLQTSALDYIKVSLSDMDKETILKRVRDCEHKLKIKNTSFRRWELKLYLDRLRETRRKEKEDKKLSKWKERQKLQEVDVKKYAAMPEYIANTLYVYTWKI